MGRSDADDVAKEACFGVSCAVIVDCRRVELEAELDVESSPSSITLHVCNVASGAKETRRFAIDFRRSARRSRIACFSACRLVWSCLFSSSVCSSRGAFVGLNGSMTFSAPDTTTWFSAREAGAGVEKSIRSSSAPDLAGDRFLVLRCRNSSNEGMALGGVNGTVGFRIDRGSSVVSV